jgi:hypothetical protein
VNDCLLFKRLTVQATSDPGASPLFAEEQVFVESTDKSVLSKSKSCWIQMDWIIPEKLKKRVS